MLQQSTGLKRGSISLPSLRRRPAGLFYRLKNSDLPKSDLSVTGHSSGPFYLDQIDPNLKLTPMQAWDDKRNAYSTITKKLFVRCYRDGFGATQNRALGAFATRPPHDYSGRWLRRAQDQHGTVLRQIAAAGVYFPRWTEAIPESQPDGRSHCRRIRRRPL